MFSRVSYDVAKLDIVELSSETQRKRRRKPLQANAGSTQDDESSLPPIKKRKSKIMNKN